MGLVQTEVTANGAAASGAAAGNSLLQSAHSVEESVTLNAELREDLQSSSNHANPYLGSSSIPSHGAAERAIEAMPEGGGAEMQRAEGPWGQDEWFTQSVPEDHPTTLNTNISWSSSKDKRVVTGFSVYNETSEECSDPRHHLIVIPHAAEINETHTGRIKFCVETELTYVYSYY